MDGTPIFMFGFNRRKLGKKQSNLMEVLPQRAPTFLFIYKSFYMD